MDLNAMLSRRSLLTNMRRLNERMMAFINELYEGDGNPEIINHVGAFFAFSGSADGCGGGNGRKRQCHLQRAPGPAGAADVNPGSGKSIIYSWFTY